MLVDIVARDAKLLRRIQTQERGVPGPEKRVSAEAKDPRDAPQATAMPQVARSEVWNIRRFKTSKRPNR